MNYLEMFIIICCVTARTDKIIIFGSTEHKLVIQTVKCTLFEGKISPLSFHCALIYITPYEIILQRKAPFVHAPSWNDCEIFIVNCKVAARNIGSKLGQDLISTVTISNSLISRTVCGFSSFGTRWLQKLLAICLTCGADTNIHRSQSLMKRKDPSWLQNYENPRM